jgi:hypothetical protein
MKVMMDVATWWIYIQSSGTKDINHDIAKLTHAISIHFFPLRPWLQGYSSSSIASPWRFAFCCTHSYFNTINAGFH